MSMRACVTIVCYTSANAAVFISPQTADLDYGL